MSMWTICMWGEGALKLCEQVNEKFLWPAYTYATFPLPVVGTELNLRHLPDEMAHIARFARQDFVSCSWTWWSRLNFCLATAHFSCCLSHIHQWCYWTLIVTNWPVCPVWTLPHSQQMLYVPITFCFTSTGWTKLGMFPGGGGTSDVIPGHLPADMVADSLVIKQEGDWGRLLTGFGSPHRWIKHA